MNILEPLYEVCIERMQELNAQNPNWFKPELEEIAHKYRSNIQYFIYKSIILRNLYGVDIMVEATEIAKLRLFLKMMAVVEVDFRADNMGLDPLPDIDFNIRCGNTLVGYATEEELSKDLDTPSDFNQMWANDEFKEKLKTEMQLVATAYETFKAVQFTQSEDMAAFKQAKRGLNERLAALNELLNRRLHKATTSIPYGDWLASHQPFHWLAEFYQIIHDNGGFDVIIGNPPYVEYSKRNVKYQVSGYKTLKSSNLYAYVFERSFVICKKNIGLIVQLSSISTESMKALQTFLINESTNLYYGCYPERPKQLFEGACIALSIILCQKQGDKSKDSCNLFGSGVLRCSESFRNNLFHSIEYISIQNSSFLPNYMLFPKYRKEIEQRIFSKLAINNGINRFLVPQSNNIISYRTAGGRYWKIFLNREFATISTSNKVKCIENTLENSLVGILNSNLFWWYYVIFFDLYNLKDYMIFNFPYSHCDQNVQSKLSELGTQLMESYENNKIVNQQYIRSKKQISIFESFNPSKSKQIIDEIDKVLAWHYGFTEEELDFIINYDIKYRLGYELEKED